MNRYMTFDRAAVAALALVALVATGCSGTDGPQASADVTEGDTAAAEGSDGGAGILVREGPTRFQELDYEVVAIDRRPDGPDDEGEDTDPAEDWVYADVDITSTVTGVSFQIPYEFIALADGEGGSFLPSSAVHRGTGDPALLYVDVEPNRTVELTLAYAVGADDPLDGGHLVLDQRGHLPAATAGPSAVDETLRVPVTFDPSMYDGPFSLDEARVEVLQAFVSRELGTDDDGVPLTSWDNNSRRPELGNVWLVVQFEVECMQTGADVGGCGVSAGEVEVDGSRTEGRLTGSGPAGYESVTPFWAVYPVPVDASAITVAIKGPDAMGADAGETAFAVTDLSPLAQLVPAG